MRTVENKLSKPEDRIVRFTEKMTDNPNIDEIKPNIETLKAEYSAQLYTVCIFFLHRAMMLCRICVGYGLVERPRSIFGGEVPRHFF